MPQYNQPPLIPAMAGADIILIWQSAAGAVKTITYSNFIAGISGGGGGTPGGAPSQVQFNNAGVFGGIVNATSDGNILTLNSPVITTPTGLVKSDVGLGNVDNTSDANKPISTATQNALNLKADANNATLTGIPVAPTAAVNTNTNQLATTAFVLSQIATSAGTVLSVSVVSANGFAGSVANPTTTPAITISTSITGILKGNGTAISAAAAASDYVAPGSVLTSGLTMATARLLGRTTASTGAIEAITVGSGLSLSAGTLTATGSGGTVTTVSVATANGFAGTVATATTTPVITLTTSITGILSGNGTAISAATTTGSGSVVLATTPTLVTPILGVATGTSLTLTGGLTSGAVSGTTGFADFKGLTSGTVRLSVADAAGTWTMKLPTSAGTNLYVLQTDGSGNTSWVPQSGGGGSGTVNSGTATRVAYYASTGTAVSETATMTVSATGRLSFQPTAVTSGVVPFLTIQTPSDTVLTAGTEAVGISLLGATRQHGSNTIIGNQRDVVFAATTHGFVTSGGTFTNLATVAIEAAPVLGTNASSATNSAALWIQAGDLMMGSGTAGVSVAKLSQTTGLLTISSQGGMNLRPSFNGAGILSIAGSSQDVVVSDSTTTTAWQGLATGHSIQLQTVAAASRVALLTVNGGDALFEGSACGGTYGALTATPTATRTRFIFRTYGGTTWVSAANIFLTTTQAHTESARGTQIAFSTTANNTTSAANALILDQDQSAVFTGAFASFKVAAATNPVIIGNISNATTYGLITFNSVLTSSGLLGIEGGASGDPNLYLQAPSTGEVWIAANAANVLKVKSTGLLCASSYTSGAPSGGTAAAWKFGTVATVSPTAQNRTIELEVGGTTYYLTAKTTNN